MSALRQGRHHQGQDRLWMQQLEIWLPIPPAILTDVIRYNSSFAYKLHTPCSTRPAPHALLHTPCSTRLERAEAPSPGQRPGSLWTQACRPERAEASKNEAIYKAFALTGRLADCYYTQGVALGHYGRKPVALKGQKLLAQGNALGNHGRKPVAL